MTRWHRPAGPLNVWKTVNGYEKLENGTKKPVKFSIQDVPNDEKRRKEVFDILHSYFVAEEPLSRSLNIKQDPEGLKNFETFWKYGMDQGVTVGCYKIESNGELGELAGVNVLFICTVETYADFFQMKDSMASDNSQRFWRLYENFMANVDVFKTYNADTYIGSASLSVKPNFRGQNLGYHMLDARSAMGKKYGIPATCTMFTAEVSQRQARRAGFEKVYELDCVNFFDDEGKQVFRNVEKYTKSVKMMGKKFA